MLPLRDTIPTSRAPVVTYAVMAASLLVYFLWQDGGSLLVLAANLLALWIFGTTVEESMGSLKFALFFLLCGSAALLAQVALDAPELGSTVVIAAVLGGYVVLFHRAKVVTVVLVPFFFTLIELPALLILGSWLLLQALLGYYAAFGGFVFGLLAIRLFSSRERVDRQVERAMLTRS